MLRPTSFVSLRLPREHPVSTLVSTCEYPHRRYCQAQCGLTESDFTRGVALVGRAGSGNHCPNSRRQWPARPHLADDAPLL